MRRFPPAVVVLLIMVRLSSVAMAQTSSLGRRAVQAEPAAGGPHAASGRESNPYQGNQVMEQNSLIAVEVRPPKEFKVHDLITIIVREQKKFEAEAELDRRKRFEVKSELEAFFKPIDGGLGATTFYRGKPNVDYEFKTRLRNEVDATHEDSFITRVTAEIIDVKPNGNLVIGAVYHRQHDEEIADITLTGQCRSSDVTPDNTILSTQLADLRIDVQNQGAVKDAATRGWVTKLLDVLKPI